MKLSIILILQLLIFSFLSCEKVESKTDFPVKFEYNILDENGLPTYEVRQGENFTFSFLMINESDSKLLFEPTIVDENWFNIYSKNSNLHERPFDSICLGLINVLTIEVMDTFEISIPWKSESDKNYWPFCPKTNNVDLTPGEYYSNFVEQFEFKTADKKQSYKSQDLSFKINFKIIK
jgi:hypothetical protein